jgi:hypothetical protein
MSDVLDLSNFYGTCSDCGKKRYSASWCVDCDVEYFLENFNNWSSGDPRIDDIIRNSQRYSKNCTDFIEWIDFPQFDLIRHMGKAGSFSTTYSAVWMECPLWNRDDAAEIWIRGGPTKVILKRLNDSVDLSDQFINQVVV